MIRIETRGLEETIYKFKQASDRTKLVIGESMREAGAKMVSDARNIVPVRTGRLRDSIKYDVSELNLILGAEAEYASYVEYGTRFQVPQPYLRPAFAANYPDLFIKILEEITGEVEK